MNRTFDQRIRRADANAHCAYCRQPAAFLATWKYRNHYKTVCHQRRPLCEFHGNHYAAKYQLDIPEIAA